MAQLKKDGKFVNLYMDRSLLEALNNYCKLSRLSKTAVIEESVRAYLINAKKKMMHNLPK